MASPILDALAILAETPVRRIAPPRPRSIPSPPPSVASNSNNNNNNNTVPVRARRPPLLFAESLLLRERVRGGARSRRRRALSQRHYPRAARWALCVASRAASSAATPSRARTSPIPSPPSCAPRRRTRCATPRRRRAGTASRTSAARRRG